MSQKYNKKWTVNEFEEGKIVAFKILRELCTSTDNLRLFYKVVHYPHKNSYELRCRHGILDRKFPIENLERVPESVAKGIVIPIITTRITLAIGVEQKSTNTRVLVLY